MEALLLWTGRLAGLAGVSLCAVSGISRLSGFFWIGDFAAATLLQAGMAGMLLGCLSFLIYLTERVSAGR
jgi:hypothetical protein